MESAWVWDLRGRLLLAGLLWASCTARVDQTPTPDSGGGGQPPGTGMDTAPAPVDATGAVDKPAAVDVPPCVNLCPRQVVCPGGGTTTVSGTVHAPTPARFGAADPLYNVLVYVPNATVSAFSLGVSCERCETASGSPLVSALTGPDGKFVLKNVPTGANVPLVVQIGRWRRQVIIPNVAACADTALPDELTRLPRNKKEGDIPAMAIATGTWDPFDCTLRKIGVDEAEFTQPTGTGRIHMFAYGGNHLAGATARNGDQLMNAPATMAKYDLVLLPCDNNGDKEPALMANLQSYADKGGRVFLTDWGYTWLRDGGRLDGTALWKPEEIHQGNDFTVDVDTSFPKGVAFSSWLSIVGAAAMPAKLPIHDPYLGASIVDDVVAPTQRWLSTPTAPRTTKSIQHMTFNTPVGLPDDKQCGRVVFSQFHVAEEGFAPDPDLKVFPTACENKPMTPQEKALEFMLFDLSSCVQPDREVPVIP